LNVVGWLLFLKGPRPLGLLVLILTVQLLAIVLWETAER
jgi:hypothetical protein